MKKIKKIVSALLIVSLMASMIAGCGGKSGGSAAKGETVTLTVFSQLANYSGIQTGWFAEVLKEKFNVELLIVPDQNGVYDTRMEAGDLGDIVVWGADGDLYKNAIKAGLLLDWEEDDLLAEEGQDILKYFPNAIEKNRSINGDGKVYGIGHAIAGTDKDHQDFMYSWDLRWDLYKELGYPEVKNLDDYFEMFKAMKQICPTDDNGNETYAFSIWPDWDGTMVMYIKAMVTAYYGYDELAIGNFDPVTGKFYGCLDDDSPYLEMLEFFNRLYREGLLDPDSMTQTYGEMSEKLENGGVFASIFNYAGSATYNANTAHIEDGKFMTAMAPADANPIVYGLSTLGGNRIWSIGAKTNYPELCMEIINWLSTPEGYMISEYGPKGVIWDYDDNGKTYFTEFGKQVRNDPTGLDLSTGSDYSGFYNDGRQQMNNITWAKDAVNPDSNGETFNNFYWASELEQPANDCEADWRTHNSCLTVNEYMENRGKYTVMPETTYSEGSKSDELKLTWEQVTKAIVDYSWKAIYAKDVNEFKYQINQMKNDAKRYGYEECLEWSLQEAAAKYALIEAIR